MTQTKNMQKKIEKFNELFLNLDSKGQDAAITILQSLNFAQSVMYSQQNEDKCKPSQQVG